MFTHVLLIVQLMVCLILAGQGLFYLLGFAKAVKTLSVAAFAEQRVAIDNAIATRLRVLYYSALTLSVGISTLLIVHADYHRFCWNMAALLLIATDIVLALKFNVPINNKFRSYPDTNTDWKKLQGEWIGFIEIRATLSVCALMALLLPWLLF